MLLALAKDVSKEAYEGGSRSGAYGRGSVLEAGSQIQVDEGISDLLASASDKPDPSFSDRKKARKVIWELLREHGVGMQAGKWCEISSTSWILQLSWCVGKRMLA